MDINVVPWSLILLIAIPPVLLVGLLKLIYRKRGGAEKGWGPALLITLCWVAALAIIYRQVNT